MLTLWKKCYDQPRQHIKKQGHYFANKGPSSQGYSFSSSHVWMWELDYKESWAPKNWCFWTVVLEETLESPSDCKEIQPVHPKGDQSWVFIGRTDVEADTPVLWPPDAKSWLIWKDPDAEKDWGQEEKGTTEDEMVWWHHWLNGHGFGWTQGVGDGQGGLACYGSWGRKESDITERLKWTEEGRCGRVPERRDRNETKELGRDIVTMARQSHHHHPVGVCWVPIICQVLFLALGTDQWIRQTKI